MDKNTDPSESHRQKDQTDEWDTSSPVDAISKLDQDFFDLVASAKWSERKEALTKLAAHLDVPRLKHQVSYSDVNQILQKAITDCNVFVIEAAVQCIGLLARGLRSHYADTARTLLPLMVEKFKEKKLNVVNALQNALNLMHPYCFSLDKLVDDIVLVSKHKVPQVKEQFLVYICSITSSTPKKSLNKNALSTLCSTYVFLMEDADQKVREASYEAFGRLMGVVGAQDVKSFFDRIDKIKQQKILLHSNAPKNPPGVRAQPKAELPKKEPKQEPPKKVEPKPRTAPKTPASAKKPKQEKPQVQVTQPKRTEPEADPSTRVLDNPRREQIIEEPKPFVKDVQINTKQSIPIEAEPIQQPKPTSIPSVLPDQPPPHLYATPTHTRAPEPQYHTSSGYPSHPPNYLQEQPRPSVSKPFVVPSHPLAQTQPISNRFPEPQHPHTLSTKYQQPLQHPHHATAEHSYGEPTYPHYPPAEHLFSDSHYTGHYPPRQYYPEPQYPRPQFQEPPHYSYGGQMQHPIRQTPSRHSTLSSKPIMSTVGYYPPLSATKISYSTQNPIQTPSQSRWDAPSHPNPTFEPKKLEFDTLELETPLTQPTDFISELDSGADCLETLKAMAQYVHQNATEVAIFVTEYIAAISERLKGDPDVCKEAIGVLLAMLDQDLGTLFQEQEIKDLIITSFDWLQAETPNVDPQSLKKTKHAFNQLVCSISEKTDRSLCLCFLLEQLANLMHESETVKYLIRSTKQLSDPTILGLIDITRVLNQIHAFLTKRPPSYWTKTNNLNPLKIVQTILSHIVQFKKLEVLDHLEGIPLFSRPCPPIVTYLNHLLRQSEDDPSFDILTIMKDPTPKQKQASAENFFIQTPSRSSAPSRSTMNALRNINTNTSITSDIKLEELRLLLNSTHVANSNRPSTTQYLAATTPASVPVSSASLQSLRNSLVNLQRKV